jgi:hypothetical protein
MDEKTLKEEMNNDLGKVQEFTRRLERVRTTRSFMLRVDGFRTIADWVLLGGAFLYTGNLLAPVVGGVVLDVVFSGLQRVNVSRLRLVRAANVREMVCGPPARRLRRVGVTFRVRVSPGRR